MSRKKPIIGLCGGIGAGKSAVAAEFGRQGCLVVDSDELNRHVLRRPDVLNTLRSWWGDAVVGPNGEPDQRRIAGLVFADSDQKVRLEELVYPLIAELREAMIKTVGEDRTVKAIILDSPLLFESNLDRRCDSIVFVEASRAQRLQRLQQARNWDEAQLRQREQWQKPLDFKRSHSEFVVDNEGSPDRLSPQITEILDRVVSRHTVQS
jgi:dephospho-CoA kinase